MAQEGQISLRRWPAACRKCWGDRIESGGYGGRLLLREEAASSSSLRVGYGLAPWEASSDLDSRLERIYASSAGCRGRADRPIPSRQLWWWPLIGHASNHGTHPETD